jgi:hypothetical protein
MDTAGLLLDAFGRIEGIVARTLNGLNAEELAFRPDAEANSIAWLVWHLTRNQDDHVADVAGTEQVWTAEGFVGRFDLPFDPGATGYGQSSAEVAAVAAVSAALLLEYYEATHTATVAFVSGLHDPDLDQVVDTNWDPPVTLGVRLISVIGDGLQHGGQASYVRGLARRR